MFPYRAAHGIGLEVRWNQVGGSIVMFLEPSLRRASFVSSLINFLGQAGIVLRDLR
jgi:hypothetical protein